MSIGSCRPPRGGIAVLVFLLGFFSFVLPPGGAGALEAVANGVVIRSLDQKELSGLARSVGSRDWIPLGELLPLMSEAWRLEARSATKSGIWEADDLAERLFEIRLEGTKGGWDLVVGGDRFTDPLRIDLTGEVLTEKALEVWVSWEGVPELKREAARFAASHGVAVRMNEVPNIHSKLLAVARARGRLPDICMLQSDHVPALAAAGIIQAADYLRVPDLVPKGFEAFRHGGRHWAVPFYFDAQLVFYNRKLVRDSVPSDWTTDDLERLAAKAAKGRTEAGAGTKPAAMEPPMAWNLYSAYWLLPFIAGFGKDSILNADGSMTVDDEPTARALGWLLDLVERRLLTPAERDAMISWFASDRAAFILSGSYNIPEFTRIGLDFGVAPYPLLSATGRPLAPLLDFKGLAIGRRTTVPVLARRFVQYLTSPTVQALFTSKLSKLPASSTAMAATAETNPHHAQLLRSYERGLVVPPAESYAAFKNVMWKMLRFCFTGRMDVATTLRTAAGLMRENLGQ